MPFPHPYVVLGTSDGHNFILERDLVYITDAGETITVPKGTTTDGASTPQVMWNLLPPFGDYFLAAVLHDFTYRCTQRPKDECDALLLEAMVSLRVPETIRNTIYQGVHVGGWKAFRDDRTR